MGYHDMGVPEVSSASTSSRGDSAGSPRTVSVAIGQWTVVGAPTKIQTLLGSCVGVVLYERAAKLGGLAHIVLPSARGATDHPGKYADTAIPAMIADFDRQLGRRGSPQLIAKLVGGASMFPVNEAPGQTSGLNIGQRNQEAIEEILSRLMIPVLARDLGGTTGRRLTLDTTSGIVTVRVPGGTDYVL
jgi:chemotaxis protein CheD